MKLTLLLNLAEIWLNLIALLIMAGKFQEVLIVFNSIKVFSDRNMW